MVSFKKHVANKEFIGFFRGTCNLDGILPMVRSGLLRVQVNFSNPLLQSVTMFAEGEYLSMLQVDKDNTIGVNYVTS
jgi:hypothetical protein